MTKYFMFFFVMQDIVAGQGDLERKVQVLELKDSFNEFRNKIIEEEHNSFIDISQRFLNFLTSKPELKVMQEENERITRENKEKDELLNKLQLENRLKEEEVQKLKDKKLKEEVEKQEKNERDEVISFCRYEKKEAYEEIDKVNALLLNGQHHMSLVMEQAEPSTEIKWAVRIGVGLCFIAGIAIGVGAVYCTYAGVAALNAAIAAAESTSAAMAIVNGTFVAKAFMTLLSKTIGAATVKFFYGLGAVGGIIIGGFVEYFGKKIHDYAYKEVNLSKEDKRELEELSEIITNNINDLAIKTKQLDDALSGDITMETEDLRNLGKSVKNSNRYLHQYESMLDLKIAKLMGVYDRGGYSK